MKKTPFIKTAPTQPNSGLALNRLKVHLGLFDDSSIDDYLTSLIITAEGTASDFLGWSIGRTKLGINAQAFRDVLITNNPNVENSKFVVRYFNEAHVSTVLDESFYYIDESEQTSIRLSFLPEVKSLKLSNRYVNPIELDYVSEMRTEVRSQKLQHAIMAYCFELHENQGNKSNDLLTSEYLLAEMRSLFL